MIDGTARVAGRTVKLQNAKLHGDQLSFEFTADVDGAPISMHFNGTVDGAAINGTADLSGAAAGAHRTGPRRAAPGRIQPPWIA